MTKKKNILAKQSNELSEARKDWTILMSRAYCRIVDIFGNKVDAWMKENKESEKQTYLELFPKLKLEEVLVHRIKRYDLAVVGKDGKTDIPTVEQFKQAFNRLADNKIIIGKLDDAKNWKRIPLVGTTEYIEGLDCMEVNQDIGTIKYLLALKDKFTLFNPWIVMKFQKSKYTFSFYEWCCQNRSKGSFDLTIREIKHRLMLDEYEDDNGILHEEKYKVMRDFVKYVIEPAKEELNELFNSGDCDVCFDYSIPNKMLDKSRPGRPIVKGFHFTITKLEKPKELPKPKPMPLYEFNNFQDRLKNIRVKIIPYWTGSNDENWPIRAINELGKLALNDMSILDKAEKFIADTIEEGRQKKVRNVPGAINGYFKKKLKIDVSIKKEIIKG